MDGDEPVADFRPLARTGFTTDAVLTVKDMILDGRLRPGDRLPSERALSTALGVSARPCAVHLPTVAQLTAEHRSIVDAICARDPERARVAMGDQIHRIRDAAVAHQNRARASAKAVAPLTRT